MEEIIGGKKEPAGRYELGLDGNEKYIYEEPDDTTYQQYLNWINKIKGICTEDRKVEASRKPVFEDFVTEGMEGWEDQAYEAAEEDYEWSKNHFVFKELHVYIRGEEIKILDSEFNSVECQGGMTLEKGMITFFLESAMFPYNITYPESGKSIEAILPVKGTLETNTDIQGILEAGLKIAVAQDNEDRIRYYKNAIEVYTKISDLVRALEHTVDSGRIARCSKEQQVTTSDVARGKTAVNLELSRIVEEPEEE